MVPTWPLTLLTTVTFADEGDKTKVTLEWKPLNASPQEEATFAHAMPTMEGGWGGSFDQLDEVLAARIKIVILRVGGVSSVL